MEFTQIHPEIRFETHCPPAGRVLGAVEWCVTGQWTMARLKDDGTGKHYWTDLPYGVGLIAPCFIDEARGEVTRQAGGRWYSDVTRHAWQNRGSEPVDIKVEVRRKARRACLVNCLNPHWGDAVSLLLRVAQLRDCGFDIVVLTTQNTAWLIPDYVAEVWLVQGGHGVASQWNDDLARQVREFVSGMESCVVPSVFQPAQVGPDELAEFTRIRPFPAAGWLERLQQRPVVTFVSREDRCWADDAGRRGLLDTRLGCLTGLRTARKIRDDWRARAARLGQARRIGALYQELLRWLPQLDFAVIGNGAARLAPGITDLRSDAIDATIERAWCERAAASHVVVGVHGSHMVLPSGHAGAVIELLPRARLVNYLQDLLLVCDDHREALYRCRLLPLGTDAGTVAATTLNILYNYPWAHLSYHRACGAPGPADIAAMREAEALRAEITKVVSAGSPEDFLGP
jgi:hypothetical protein